MSESSPRPRSESGTASGTEFPHAQLTLDISETAPLGRLSRAFPEVRFRVLAATTGGSGSVLRVDVIGPAAAEVREELAADGAVSGLDVIERVDRRRRLQIETGTPAYLAAFERAGVPLATPFEIADGRLRFEAALARRQLSELGERLDAAGIGYTVDRIRHREGTDRLLTDRQRWLLHEAIERGYYDTPRRITLVELADELGIAKSTCSETLHRCEGRVLKQFTDGDCEHQPDVSVRTN